MRSKLLPADSGEGHDGGDDGLVLDLSSLSSEKGEEGEMRGLCDGLLVLLLSALFERPLSGPLSSQEGHEGGGEGMREKSMLSLMGPENSLFPFP